MQLFAMYPSRAGDLNGTVVTGMKERKSEYEREKRNVMIPGVICETQGDINSSTFLLRRAA